MFDLYTCIKNTNYKKNVKTLSVVYRAYISMSFAVTGQQASKPSLHSGQSGAVTCSHGKHYPDGRHEVVSLYYTLRGPASCKFEVGLMTNINILVLQS